MNRVSGVWFLVIGLSVIAAACDDLPTDHHDAGGSAVTAVAAGPVVISRGADETTYSSLTVACSGELVAIEARQQYRWQVSQHPTGDWALSQHMTFHIDGVGQASGVKYVGSGVFNTVQIFAAPVAGAFTFISSSHQVGITQGPSDNSAFQVLAKWTIDSKGNVTVDSFRVEWICRG